MFAFFGATLFLGMAGAMGAQAATRQFTLDDIAKLVSLSDPQIAPDGKRIAVVVSRPDLKKDVDATQLTLVDVASGAQRNLTPSRNRVESPQWSADGSQLAFIAPSGEDKDAKPQVWILPMNGGEARMATSAENGVESYAWRPDGKAVAYSTPDTPRDKKALEDHHDLFVVGDNDFLTQKAPVPSHVWLQRLAENAKPERLTDGPESDSGELSWSQDGRFLAYDQLPDAYFGHFLHQRAVILNVATRTAQPLGDSWTASARFAPSGKRIAYFIGKEQSLAVQNQLVVGGGDNRQSDLAPAIDRDPQWFAWMPSGESLAFAGHDRVDGALWITTDGQAAQRVDLPGVNFEEGSVAHDGSIAFVGSTSRNPSELYVLSPSHALKRLTAFNTWLEGYRLGATREFTWTNDGFHEDGVLTYPAGYEAGRTYPLALVIHGGPTQSASLASFSSLAQELAGHGYFVLQPNYRGSDNLGFKYADAMIGPNVYVGAGTDVIAGVNALLATGMIDRSRIGVSGWSGGGWMTSWLITHSHLWRAAVSGAAVDDCVLQYSLEDVTDYLPALFGGLTPWNPQGMAAYRKNSPITYVGDVTAPTLILSDTGDYRVPEPEAYEFYKALRDERKTVEFVAIPAYGHFPSDPVREIDTYKRWAGWLERYL